MNNNKHTQGKWGFFRDSTTNDSKHYVYSEGVGLIATIPNEGAIDKQEANAKLIAAAPELLAALIKCQHQLQTYAELDSWDTQDEEAYELASEAINKATI